MFHYSFSSLSLFLSCVHHFLCLHADVQMFRLNVTIPAITSSFPNYMNDRERDKTHTPPPESHIYSLSHIYTYIQGTHRHCRLSVFFSFEQTCVVVVIGLCFCHPAVPSLVCSLSHFASLSLLSDLCAREFEFEWRQGELTPTWPPPF